MPLLERPRHLPRAVSTIDSPDCARAGPRSTSGTREQQAQKRCDDAWLEDEANAELNLRGPALSTRLRVTLPKFVLARFTSG